ncbi:50S ribosomal protein L4, partial [Alistipes onderdonkii]|uniref:50S ribosomal protein L4 n=1 Tax=Alistipes onderdonkii TaxID=328813 RepID=UPI0039772761
VSSSQSPPSHEHAPTDTLPGNMPGARGFLRRNGAAACKLKRQKGTGGARAGSIKSPLFPGGGRIFGPQPRDYSFKLNKKLKQLAHRSALTYKAQAGVISVVEPI